MGRRQPLDYIVGSLAGGASTLIFVDACRNDPRISSAMGAKGRGFRPLDPVRGGRRFIGLSTRLGDTADDDVAGKGSPFARAFSANMRNPNRACFCDLPWVNMIHRLMVLYLSCELSRRGVPNGIK